MPQHPKLSWHMHPHASHCHIDSGLQRGSQAALASLTRLNASFASNSNVCHGQHMSGRRATFQCFIIQIRVVARMSGGVMWKLLSMGMQSSESSARGYGERRRRLGMDRLTPRSELESLASERWLAFDGGRPGVDGN
eukprot:gnl/TRDRNA2_/TRDRNA2_177727_c1_seq22.p2 gnl/TRDRNA2_/TRDRNA2_177727_c1~~gnl/TRDRNA2_/TRDRNA2_177727_c1_seq22.p2  ORF type:complete len:137 (+),score=12.70 gnl/TRDRNA2_/TRDRNA2_177727_c1_seq22:140-550(+)